MFEQPRLDRAPSVSCASDFHNINYSSHPTLFSLAGPAARSSTSNRQTTTTSAFAAGNCFSLYHAICFARPLFAIYLLQLKNLRQTPFHGKHPSNVQGVW